MIPWKLALREGLAAGSLASLLSTLCLVAAGARRGQPAAPLNAPGHWVFGDRALREDRPSAPFTLTGLLIHHGASVFWGVLHARAWGARPECKRPARAALGATTAAAVACLVDFRLTPGRFTPGFEHRLARHEIAQVYAWFAVGLAVGSALMSRAPPPQGCE